MTSTAMRGPDLLRDPARNRGTAFTEAQRDALGLTGLLPAAVETLQQRIKRVRWQLEACATDLARYILLAQLMDTDETLFYGLLAAAPEVFLPIIYTPTVGDACEEFGHIHRRARGLFLPITHKGRIKEMLANWPERDIRFIVVTDGSRILGLGDLGANGMGIPIGKLACYTGAAGVPPEKTLPITLDVGTDRDDLRDAPMYIGLRRKRPEADEYYAFIEEFITAVEESFPDCCVQFEDFNIHHAEPLLEKYRHRLCCFNDDIQGTAGVAVGGLYSACRAKGETIGQQRVLFLGAGSAGCGIAGLIEKAMQADGLSADEAAHRVALFDQSGLLTKDRTDLSEFQSPMAINHAPETDFAAMIRSYQPTAIIGVSTAGGAFNENVLKAMMEVNKRPIIFPYSNPTSHSECTAAEAYAATNGECLFASGSPMPPLEHNGETIYPAQGNNVYIFPAMGLAIYATQATYVSDQMFLRAGQALAETLNQDEMKSGLLYPKRHRLRECSLHVATEIAKQIFADGHTDMTVPDDIAAFVLSFMWQPAYGDEV